MIQIRSVLPTILLLLTAISWRRVQACAIGSVTFEECGGVGETTKLKARLDVSCDFLVSVYWGDMSRGYNANSTEFTNPSGGISSLGDFFVEHNYSEPGDYNIDVTIQGYDNLTSFEDLLLAQWRIQVNKKDVARLAIREDSCEELPDSGAAGSWRVGFLAFCSLSVAWFVF